MSMKLTYVKNNSHADNKLLLLLNRYSLFECSTDTNNYNPPETLKYHNGFIEMKQSFVKRTSTVVVTSPK